MRNNANSVVSGAAKVEPIDDRRETLRLTGRYGSFHSSSDGAPERRLEGTQIPSAQLRSPLNLEIPATSDESSAWGLTVTMVASRVTARVGQLHESHVGMTPGEFENRPFAGDTSSARQEPDLVRRPD